MRRTQRLEAIRKANDLIYEQTDKMKMLKSQKLYADVIHHRFQQMDDHKKEGYKEFELEKGYHAKILEQVKAAEEVELEKERKRLQLNEDVRIARAEQLEEVRLIREREKQEEIEQGIRMKEQIKKRLEEDVKAHEERQEHIRIKNLENAEANRLLKIEKARLQKEEEEAERIRDAEVEVIEKRKKALKDLQLHHQEQAQRKRQSIIDAAVKALAEKSSTENALLNKQENDIKEREDNNTAAKEAKQKREWDDIVNSRTVMAIRRKEADRIQKLEDAEEAKRAREANEQAIFEAKEKARLAKERTLAIKSAQYAEGEERRRLKEEQARIEREQAKLLGSLTSDDDERFTAICKKEIENNIRQGKPVYTLLRALEYTAPELLAAKTNKK